MKLGLNLAKTVLSSLNTIPIDAKNDEINKPVSIDYLLKSRAGTVKPNVPDASVQTFLGSPSDIGAARLPRLPLCYLRKR